MALSAYSAGRRFPPGIALLEVALVAWAAWTMTVGAAAALPTRAAAVQVRKLEVLAGDGVALVRPAWSPDSQWLALGRSGMAGIELLRRDGKERKTLTLDAGSGYKFAWSPDGREIAYRAAAYSSNQTSYVIKSIVLATGRIRELSQPAGEVSPPVWAVSNGQQRVSFMVGTNRVNSAWTVSGGGAHAAAAIARDTLLYTDAGQVWRSGPAQGARTRLTEAGGMEPVWSPDRTQIVYSQMGTLMLMEPDGSKKRELVHGHHPSWSPDGRMLVYDVSVDDGHQILGSDLYVVNADGSEPTRLTNTPKMLECEPAWSPDGKCIACRTEESGHVLLLWLE